MFRGETTPIEKILKDDDEEGHRFIRRTCKVKVINHTERTIKDVVVKLEAIDPKPNRIMLPIELKFTGDTRQSVSLHPRESKFVDVMYWEFPRGRVPKEEWEWQYYICSTNKDIRIKQLNYTLNLVAYGENIHAEKRLIVGKPFEGSGYKEIWMYEAP